MATAKSLRTTAAATNAFAAAESNRRRHGRLDCESGTLVPCNGDLAVAGFRQATEKQFATMAVRADYFSDSKCIFREDCIRMAPCDFLYTRDLLSMPNKYDLEGRIGEGGCGEVFRARHLASGATFAAKRGLKSCPNIAHSFEVEAQALAKFDHPNVVRLIEVFSDADYVYIIEELCSGPTLMELLEQSPVKFDAIPYLPETYVADIFRQCLQAISACHLQGLAHRDVKLENFVISDSGTVKLVDFGTVGATKNDCKDGDQITTTLQYMAPDMLRDSHTIAVDIWSLGIVFFGLLTGEALFNCCDDRVMCSCLRDALYVKRRLAESTALSQIGISETALDLLRQMLEHDPSKRITAEVALAHPFFDEAPRGAAARTE